MTTASNAIKACIEDNWNAGSGGTEPIVYTGAEEGMYPSTAEWVFLKTWEYAKRRKRRNDSFVKEDDYVGLRVYTRNHANKEERLDEMVNEIYRIVTPTNVTGYHKVDIIDQHRRATDKRQEMYVADLTVELKILSTASSAVPGSTESGNDWSMDSLIFTDGGSKVDIIRDEDDMATDDADALATQQSIKSYVDNQPNTDSISNDGVIALKPSGDTDDYFEFSTVANVPTIALKGTHQFEVISDGATNVSMILKQTAGAKFLIDWSKSTTEGVLRTYGGGIRLQSAEYIKLQPNNDTDDYITFTTTADVPKIGCIGGSNLEIDTDGGDIAMLQDVVMSGDLTVGVVDSPAGTNLVFKRAGGSRIECRADYIYMVDDVLLGAGKQVQDSGANNLLGGDGAGNTTLYDAGGDITVAQLADLLMFGSANAAWVPCMYQMHSYTGGFVSDGPKIKGVGTNNSSMLWSLPLPTVKGALKLYITGLQVGLEDADASNYIDRVIIYGADFDTATEILNDATDYTAPAEVEYALADTDCSTYKVIHVVISTVKATTGAIDFRNVALSCFYAT